MKRIVAMLLLAVLLALPVMASASVNMDLFDRAKSALSYISYGEYAKALKKMGLGSGKEAAKKLRDAVADDLSTALYGEVQTDVAVCYAVEKGYKLAVPVENPSVGGVEALVMQSRDGETFSGYRMAMWIDCEAEAAASPDVIWHDAVRNVDPLIVAD